MGNNHSTGFGARPVDQRSAHAGHHRSEHQSHQGHDNHRTHDGHEREQFKKDDLETRTKHAIQHGRERMDRASDYAKTKADQLANKAEHAIDHAMDKAEQFGHKVEDSIDRVMSDAEAGGRRDGSWQPAKQRELEASRQMESDTKQFIREGRERANRASDKAMVAAYRAGRTLPETSRQDEDIIQNAVARTSKGAVVGAGGGLGLALVIVFGGLLFLSILQGKQSLKMSLLNTVLHC